jgi:hypothetical protein
MVLLNMLKKKKKKIPTDTQNHGKVKTHQSNVSDLSQKRIESINVE